MTIRHRLLHYFTTTALLSASLTGAAVVSAPAASAADCPTGFSLVSGTTDICELPFKTVGTQSWTVPAEVANIDLLVVGGGGDGGNGSATNSGGGGGGGATIVATNYAVAPGSSFSITVGRGGRFWQWSSDYSEISLNPSTYLKAFGGGGASFGGTGAGSGQPFATYQGFSNLSIFPGDDGQSGVPAHGAGSPEPTSGTTVAQGLFQFGGQIRVGGGGGGGTPSQPGTSFTGSRFTSNSGGGGGGSQVGQGSPRDGRPGIVVIRTQIQTATAPDAPTSVSAVAGNGEAAVSWTAPANDGGDPITSYTVTASPGGATASGASSPLTVTGLSNGTAYTFTVTASNNAGPGTASTASPAVTPRGLNWSAPTSATLADLSVDLGAAVPVPSSEPVTYAVVNPGTTGCQFDGSNPTLLTYSAGGTCQVSATLPSTADQSAVVDTVNILISRATPTLTWNPSLSFEVLDGSTTFLAASTSSDDALSYTLTTGASNTAGCSLVGRELTFTQAGSCEVTASVDQTTRFEAASESKTFAISKTAQNVTWSPATSLTLATLSTDLGAASRTGDGDITYSATSSGSENCRFPDNTSPVLHYDAAGSCTVVTTAAETTNYAQGTQSAIITLSLATPSVTWSPTTTVTMPAVNFIPSAPTSTSGGTFTYALADAGTTGCNVNAGSGEISYAAPGQCQITATSQSTTRYTAGSATVTFTVSLAPQTITAAAGATSLRPRGTTTVSSSGSSGSGTISWTNTTPAICSLTGTTVTADANGSCILTVEIDADATYAAASDSITIAVTTPPPPAGGGGSGGGSGGASGGGSSGSGGGSSSTASSGGSGSGSSGGAGASGSTGGATQSQDDVEVPGTGSTTRGRALPPPPTEVDVVPLRSGVRSSVLIKQPVGAAGAQVLATVVVVRNAKGKVISRINIELEPGQTQTRVTVPYVADGYSVDVYNVNEVGVSTGALTRSPLVRATTITKRTSSGQPRLFGKMIGKPIIFNGGSAALDKRDKKQLRAIAREAKKSNERLFVTGFARKGGGTASELASLSTKRARAAATYLSKRGVRVWIRYWGAGSLNGNGTASDRRVEVRISAAPIPRSLVP